MRTSVQILEAFHAPADIYDSTRLPAGEHRRLDLARSPSHVSG